VVASEEVKVVMTETETETENGDGDGEKARKSMLIEKKIFSINRFTRLYSNGYPISSGEKDDCL